MIELGMAGFSIDALDYGYDPKPRPDAAGRARLSATFQAAEPRMKTAIRLIATLAKLIESIPDELGEDPTPYWANGWFPGLDGLSPCSLNTDLELLWR